MSPGPTCSLCAHPGRDAIDRRIAAGESSTTIAADYGVSDRTVRRHLAHVADTLTRARGLAEASRAEALADQVGDLLRRGFALLDRAERGDSVQDACGAMREVRGIFTLLAKISGQIDNRPQINIIQSPEWLRVQTAILLALEAYPDARQAVADALARVDP